MHNFDIILIFFILLHLKDVPKSNLKTLKNPKHIQRLLMFHDDQLVTSIYPLTFPLRYS